MDTKLKSQQFILPKAKKRKTKRKSYKKPQRKPEQESKTKRQTKDWKMYTHLTHSSLNNQVTN